MGITEGEKKEKDLQGENQQTKVLLRDRHLKRLMDQIPGGLGIYEIRDGEVYLMYLNNAYYELIGFEREDRKKFYGTRFFEVVYPEDRCVMENLIEDLKAGKDKASTYCRILDSRGEWIWLNMAVSVVTRQKDLMEVYVSYTDCDELVRSQSEREKRYLRQLESMSEVDDRNLIAKGRHNLSKNRTLFFQRKMEYAIKIENGEDYGEAVRKLKVSAVREVDQNRIVSTMDREKLMQDYTAGRVEGSLEYQRKTKDDRLIWVALRYSLFEEPVSQDIIAFIYSYDITERVIDNQIVETLSRMEYEGVGLIDTRTRQYRLRNVLREIERPEIIGSGDFDERVVQRLARNLVDSEREEIVSKFRLDHIIAQLEREPLYYLTYFIRDEKNQVRRKKCQFCYLDDTKRVILYCRSDITEIYQREQEQLHATERALKEAREANHAKSAFLSQMSHDIRTPMNTILNLTRLVKGELDDRDAVLEDLKKIETSNQFLLSLVNDILDMARIEQKNIELTPERYSYKEFINYIESTFCPLSREKKIEFRIVKGEKDLDIMIDKVRFNQLCFNLISNAIKYTPVGGHVEFRMVHGEIKDGILPCDIYVSDDGIGMSQDFQRHMFEPFAQEGRAYRSVEGTGLGLSIVKEIVTLLKGSIEVRSELNQGSVFHVHIDMELAKGIREEMPEEDMDLKILHKKRVLLAEDHILNQEIAKRLLEHVGICTTIVNNGQEALDLFRSNEQEFDAILMDMRMPLMDGITAARSIRALNDQNARSIPIIAMTANAFAQDREESREAGMDAHLAKPIDPQELYHTLAELMGRKISQ